MDMRCIEITAFGEPEVLRETRCPIPAPHAGEVLVRVRAAGVNRPDVAQRLGHYPPPPGASPIPGLEIAGEIVALGDGVDGWRAGTPVCALISGGGYAEYARVPQGQLLPVPTGLSLTEAACLPETAFTVWSNVFRRGGLRAGEVFLVHGGSSGIGTMAIQLARAFGARVVATAGNARKCGVCHELGAELAVNYRETDFVTAVKAFSGGRGADLILDMVGGEYIQRNIQCAAEDGRIVQIAFLQGATAPLNMMPVMLKRLTITGSTLRARPDAFKAELAREVEQNVWPLIEAGKVRVVMAQDFDLSDAAAAHRLMESSAHIGKIALRV